MNPTGPGAPIFVLKLCCLMLVFLSAFKSVFADVLFGMLGVLDRLVFGLRVSVPRCCFKRLLNENRRGHSKPDIAQVLSHL